MSRSEVECEIRNELGLHLRAAAAFVKVAEGYESDISLQKGSMKANGKSVIAIVTLAAPQGTRVRVVAEGVDAEEATKALAALIHGGFGESV